MNFKSTECRWLSLRLTICLFGIAMALMFFAMSAQGQTAAFTYQGRLTDGGTPANGNYDLRFKLFDTAEVGTGTQQPQPNPVTVTLTNVGVSAGIFTVQLDFGASAFPSANRFLEISARLVGTPSFTTLSPRQPITSTPYAVRSLNASSADAVTVSGVPGGSGNYIQNNPASPQAANFNISGNGTASGTLSAETVNATTHYNLGGTRILGAAAAFDNLFAGFGAGQNTTGQPFSGHSNSFFGARAGQVNTTGSLNAFFGVRAGFSSTKGSNSFFGAFAGQSNTEGSLNTTIGIAADVGPGIVNNSTAIGALARVDQSDSLVLGSVAGINGAIASVKVGIGTTTPLAALDTRGIMLVSGNVGIGTTTPTVALDVNGAGVFRPAGLASPRGIVFGGPNSETGITITGPNNRADVRFDGQTLRLVAGLGTGPPPHANGLAIDVTSGTVAIGQPSSSATSIHVCLDSANRLSFCSSSLRYKENVAPFSIGLELIRRLRPISFTWKNIGTRDLGLGAEDVAKVEPLLVTHNDKGEIQGVKYDQLNVILINAIKQQQRQIEELRTEVRELRTALRKGRTVPNKSTRAK